MLRTRQDITNLIKEDEWMMEILRGAAALNLPDWWVCAGFIRSKVWDTLHDYEERTPMPDVDVVYFDPEEIDEAFEKELEQRLREINPSIPWSVKNEARMHTVNGLAPYTSTVDAISKFPETATAFGVTLDEGGEIKLAAPCGVEDLLTMTLAPTSYFKKDKNRLQLYENRMKQKNWQEVWPKVTILTRW